LQPLRRQLRLQSRDAGDAASRTGEARDVSGHERIEVDRDEHDRRIRTRLRQRLEIDLAAAAEVDVAFELPELGGHGGHPLEPAIAVAFLQDHLAAIDESEVGKAFLESERIRFAESLRGGRYPADAKLAAGGLRPRRARTDECGRPDSEQQVPAHSHWLHPPAR